MALQPLFTLILLVNGLLMLLIVERISVFALTFFAVETIYAWMVVSIGEWWVPALVTVYLLLAVIAHRPDLVRLAQGEEKPLGLYHLLKYGKRTY